MGRARVSRSRPSRQVAFSALCALLGLCLLGNGAMPRSAEAQGGDGGDGAAQDHVLPFFTPAGDVQEGFARIINRSPRSGTVSITGTDDAGGRYGPVTLSLGARQTRHFNSDDLEGGNAAKGLSGGLGKGEGYWRLSLASELDLEVGAYIRTADGFLSSVHDVVPAVEVGARPCIGCRCSTREATATR